MMKRVTNTTWTALALGLMTSAAFGDPTVPRLSRLAAFPREVSLETRNDRQALIVQAVYDDGSTRDVTGEVRFTTSGQGLARIEGSTVFPVADGVGELKAVFDHQSVIIPLRVTNARQERPIGFRPDVMPVFMRAGCNAGKCHGAAKGKDGFRLSLFGYDPAGDHYRLTRELGGRRINLSRPEDSLLIKKALGDVVHTGGRRFDAESEFHRLLLGWLEAGAGDDGEDGVRPTALEILPGQIVLPEGGATHRLIARAKYSDGSDRDVTRLAIFLSNNDSSATVSEDGLVTTKSRGEAFILARFATFTVGTNVLVVPRGPLPTDSGPAARETKEIDRLVNAKLVTMRILPSEACSDEVFLRRAFLDLAGLLPTRRDYELFMADRGASKRERLVDELLARKEWSGLWTMKWAELLQIRTTNNIGSKSTFKYYHWLRRQIEQNRPMDQVARDLIASSGSTFADPPTNFYLAETNPPQIAENVAQVFMGIRIQCAQCHNHPFDRWTQNDYFGFTAFFAQLGYKQTEDPREVTIFNRGTGEVRHPVTNSVVAPKFLGGGTPVVDGRDIREVLGRWLSSEENPYFARNLVNIAWAQFFGRGIVDPVDDVRVSNPPSNPELLDALARKYVDSRYDFKGLLREIATSLTYRRSGENNPANSFDERYFSHALVRRIRAEVLLDCVSQVTETRDKFTGVPRGARAVDIIDGQVTNDFLTTFGRSTRKTVCACEVKTEPSLSQALHLINGNTISGKIKAGRVVERLLAAGKTRREIIEELYIRCLSRKPSPDEISRLESETSGDDPREPLEDVFWALLNSKEFLFNH